MNYVTIKNGVATPITERKQLYYKNTTKIYNPIILDYVRSSNNDEGIVNNNIDWNNIKGIKIDIVINNQGLSDSYSDFYLANVRILNIADQGPINIVTIESQWNRFVSGGSLIYNKEDETFYYNNMATNLTKSSFINNNTYSQKVTRVRYITKATFTCIY